MGNFIKTYFFPIFVSLLLISGCTKIVEEQADINNGRLTRLNDPKQNCVINSIKINDLTYTKCKFDTKWRVFNDHLSARGDLCPSTSNATFLEFADKVAL